MKPLHPHESKIIGLPENMQIDCRGLEHCGNMQRILTPLEEASANHRQMRDLLNKIKALRNDDSLKPMLDGLGSEPFSINGESPNSVDLTIDWLEKSTDSMREATTAKHIIDRVVTLGSAQKALRTIPADIYQPQDDAKSIIDSALHDLERLKTDTPALQELTEALASVPPLKESTMQSLTRLNSAVQKEKGLMR